MRKSFYLEGFRITVINNGETDKNGQKLFDIIFEDRWCGNNFAKMKISAIDWLMLADQLSENMGEVS